MKCFFHIGLRRAVRVAMGGQPPMPPKRVAAGDREAGSVSRSDAREAGIFSARRKGEVAL